MFGPEPNGYGSKLNQQGTTGFTFWVPIFDPQPNGGVFAGVAPASLRSLGGQRESAELVDGVEGEDVILWMDEILHHFETTGNHCLLVFTGQSFSQGFLGGAGFRPSTVLWDETHCAPLGIDEPRSKSLLINHLATAGFCASRLGVPREC